MNPLNDLQSYHLSVSESPLQFDPTNSAPFWNTRNKEMVIMGDSLLTRYTKIVGKETEHVSLQIQNRGRSILNVLFSPTHQYIAVQRTATALEFTFIEESVTCTVSCKKSSSEGQRILGFHWSSKDNIFIVTHRSLELYKVVGSAVKLQKWYSLTSCPFYVYNDKRRVLMAATPGKGDVTVMQGFRFKPDVIVRLPKVELRSVSQEALWLVNLYDQVFLMNLVDQRKMDMWAVSKEEVRKAMQLDLMVHARFAINAVDNLVVVHNLDARVSMLYDVRLASGAEFPCAGALQIAPVADTDTYGAHWQYIMPNVVLDAHAGLVWALELRVADVAAAYPAEPEELIRFLLRRARSKTLILDAVYAFVHSEAPLASVAAVFDLLNRVVASLPVELRVRHGGGQVAARGSQWRQRVTPAHAADAAGIRTSRWEMIVSQSDIHNYVFPALDGLSKEYAVSVVLEYVRSLAAHNIEVIPCVCEELVALLASSGNFHQLAVYVRRRVIVESVPVANMLLCIARGAVYPPARQLALDVLTQIQRPDLLLEVLLEEGDILAAMRLVESSGIQVAPERLLEAAVDESLYHVVFRYFESKGHSLPPQEIQRFSKMFPVINSKATS